MTLSSSWNGTVGRLQQAVGFSLGNGLAKIAPNVFEDTLDFVGDGHRSEDNDVGVSPSWTDVTFCHGRDDRPKLLAHGLRRAAAFTNIALAPSFEADIVGHVDIDPGAKMVPQFGPVQCEKAFNNHEFTGLEELRLAGAEMDGEIVGRHIDRLALAKIPDLRDQKVVLERSGLVEISLHALNQREMRQVAVVVVERQHRRVEPFSEVTGEVAFACTRRPGYADEIGLLGHAGTV